MAQSQHLPAYTQQDVKQALISKGASGTIYAFAFPESRLVLQEVLDGGDRKEIVNKIVAETIEGLKQDPSVEIISQKVNTALAAARNEYTGMYEGAWTGRQDQIDQHFFEAWREWSAPVVTLNDEQWKYTYPTAGASEGLRECINQYSIRARLENFQPTIHVFEGEYEGFTAYAQAAGVPIIRHDRNEWHKALTAIGPYDQFYISQPSAIDGNVWEGFDAFAQALNHLQPTAQLMLDLTYVGSVAKEFHICADHPNIPVVFFSLSKPFGVYYHRIGGLLSRNPIDSLIGNKWFKNIQSLQVGTALLRRSNVYDLARKYEPVRQEALENIRRNLDMDLELSDVFLFATAPANEATTDVKKTLLRGALGRQFVRVCITPEIARIAPHGVYIDENQRYIKPPSAVTGPQMKDLSL